LYVEFDHLGPGEARNEDEAPNRVWLRLVNNCTVSIQIVVNGFPPGHMPADEVALQDQVVADPHPFMTIESPPPMSMASEASKATEESTKANDKPPYGYWIDVGSSEYIRPGKSILFSLPTSQFRKGWHIEISYEFPLPKGKGPLRPENIGGLPVMYLEYGLSWLPKDIQQKVEEENAKH
jgi:hypothetical protein